MSVGISLEEMLAWNDEASNLLEEPFRCEPGSCSNCPAILAAPRMYRVFAPHLGGGIALGPATCRPSCAGPRRCCRLARWTRCFNYIGRPWRFTANLLASPAEEWDAPYALEFDWVPAELRKPTRRKVAAHALFHSQRHWAQLATLLRQGGLPIHLPGRSALQSGAEASLAARAAFSAASGSKNGIRPAALRRLERNCGFRAALRAGRPRLRTHSRCDPRARFALHCLQCLGSFLNCLSWKKTCSPAVKINSAPQSVHFSTRSWNSMFGRLPLNRENHRNRPSWKPCRSRFPVSFVIHMKGPDRIKEERLTSYCGETA